MATEIEWTDETWNPVTGCTKVSSGCDHCYAERVTERFHGKGSFATVQLHPERLDKPLHWRKPRKVFVNSMSDLFHDQVPDEYIAQVFAVMAACPHHTFQLLTKRHGRMQALLSNELFPQMVGIQHHWSGLIPNQRRRRFAWPVPNVHLGVTVENQQWAGIRVPALLGAPAAVRFVSCEPLLGPVDLTDVAGIDSLERDWSGGRTGGTGAPHPLVDWVIAGGESGPQARPMQLEWARGLRDQCQAAGVPFLFKQWGGRTAKANGRELDGELWDEYPEATS